MFFVDCRSSSFIHISIPYGTVSSFTSPLHPSQCRRLSTVKGSTIQHRHRGLAQTIFFLVMVCLKKKSDFQIPQIWNSWRVGKPKYFRAPNFVKTHAAAIHNSTTNSPYPWHWRHLHALFQTLKISLAEMEKVTTTPQGLAWMISDG